MSLIRSRVVRASPETAKEVAREIARILSRPRDEKKLREEMLDMRARVEKQHGSKDPWNLKHRRGGLMDVMFAAHFLALKNAAKHKGLLHPSVADTLRALARKKLVAAGDAKALLRAQEDAQAVQAFLRLSAELPFDPKKAAKGLQAALAASVRPKKKIPFRQFAAEITKHLAAGYAAYRKIFKA